MGTPFKMSGFSGFGNSPMKLKDNPKTSRKSKIKSAWYTIMHHEGGDSSPAEMWKTYKEKKKEFRDNNKGKKAGKPDKNVSWKSGF
jgi:NADH:ubiquinone oxidoreductase subunit